ISGKIGENLCETLHRLPLNRDLTRIKTDLALDEGFADLGMREKDMEALRTLFSRYGMNQALKELEGGNGEPTPRASSRPLPAQRIVAPEQEIEINVPAGWSERGSYVTVQDEAQ